MAKLIMSYVISWFYWFYFILLPNDMFPMEAEVKKALRNRPDDAVSEAILEKCSRLFWIEPATTLQGLLPGILEQWDSAYMEHLPTFEGTSLCDPMDEMWVESWSRYAESMISELVKLSQASSYVKLPPRATSCLRYFLYTMTDYHNVSVFPTKTFIRDIATSFSESKETFCDVSTVIFHLVMYYITWIRTPATICSCILSREPGLEFTRQSALADCHVSPGLDFMRQSAPADCHVGSYPTLHTTHRPCGCTLHIVTDCLFIQGSDRVQPLIDCFPS